MKRGKKYKTVAEKIDKNKSYPIDEAVKLVREKKIAKFDESVEIHIKLSIDTKKGEEQVRGTVVLPHGTGKSKKVAVITSTKVREAKDAKADIVGGEEMITKLKSGKFNFDVLVATPEMMPRLASIAKILGPKGLMPSPKTETVTEKVKETVEMLKKGKVNFKNDDTGNIHQIIGKVSFTEEQLKGNFEAFLEAVKKAKPATVKGKFIKSISVCSTMGPGIKIGI
ncbi:MAG: 50S ribosomal protein L1 [Candidatus Moranbacteria bacterium]|nr:50S ribosomal protein L1 [Candidatus Moranbacteria bacterium]